MCKKEKRMRLLMENVVKHAIPARALRKKAIDDAIFAIHDSLNHGSSNPKRLMVSVSRRGQVGAVAFNGRPEKKVEV
jgi:hypothetical protein